MYLKMLEVNEITDSPVRAKLKMFDGHQNRKTVNSLSIDEKLKQVNDSQIILPMQAKGVQSSIVAKHRDSYMSQQNYLAGKNGSVPENEGESSFFMTEGRIVVEQSHDDKTTAFYSAIHQPEEKSQASAEQTASAEQRVIPRVESSLTVANPLDSVEDNKFQRSSSNDIESRMNQIMRKKKELNKQKQLRIKMEQVQKEIEFERAKKIVENARAEEESRLAYLRRAI